jgi:HTH-type transcriptional regulator / antitoxin HigA
MKDPVDAIKFMMEQKNLKSKDLVGILGDKANVSKILSRKRRLTIDMIRDMNEKFNIPVDILIKEYKLKK